ncbi:hypothetical protein HanIR_Chr13g0630101 [Helianthus annuus]|nr:hypothetical protein HanIR_Chr13g0630101 [Helianthus annuus]
MDVVGGTRTQLKVFKNDEDASVDSVDATFSLFASLFKSALQGHCLYILALAVNSSKKHLIKYVR